MDKLQFYPTTKALAEKAWSLFRNLNLQRVLDPSGGNGDLLLGCPHYERCGHDKAHQLLIEAITSVLSKHQIDIETRIETKRTQQLAIAE